MSYRKECANLRRNERQAPPATEVPKPKPRKNRRQWCRGKVGIEHKPVCQTYAEAKPTSILNTGEDTFRRSDWRVLVCTVCGKELDYYYPLAFNNIPHSKKNPPPAWVTK